MLRRSATVELLISTSCSSSIGIRQQRSCTSSPAAISDSAISSLFTNKPDVYSPSPTQIAPVSVQMSTRLSNSYFFCRYAIASARIKRPSASVLHTSTNWPYS